MALGQIGSLLAFQRFRDYGPTRNAGLVLEICLYLLAPAVIGLALMLLLGVRNAPLRRVVSSVILATLILGLLGHGLEDAGLGVAGFVALCAIVVFVVAFVACGPEEPMTRKVA